jgi:tetratricopeptide (TPR) repeat protein
MLGEPMRAPALLLFLLLPVPAIAQDPAALRARAVSLHQAGDLEGAVAAYRELIALAPRSGEAHANLGAALAALGRYGEALAAYDRALELLPGNRGVRTNRALALYKSADLPRATAELQALQDEQPSEARVTLLLADCRLQLGEYGRAQELLLPLESARPDDRAVLYALAMACIRGGRPEEGQRRIERLLRGGDSAEAQYLLGSAAFETGRYPAASEHFAKALAGNPKLPGLRSYYGRALLFTGDADGAERALREALAASPTDYDAAFYLASILGTRGRAAEARPLAARALQLRPQSEEAKALIAQIDDPTKAAAPAEASPLVGKPAPDVELRGPDGRALNVSSLKGKPAVLVFGSYTCPQLRHGAPAINRLQERYGSSVRFLLVYIREAHPRGEWQSTINQREGVELPQAASLDERATSAELCRKKLDVRYAAALDDMDGAAEAAYGAFPSRAFVLDAAGTVVFSTALDVETFRPAALEAALAGVTRDGR